MKTVVLERLTDDGHETIGRLSVDAFLCDTMERPYLGNQHQISAIPCGKYKCVWSLMPSAGRNHFKIMNVPNRDGVFLHAGNKTEDTKGCPLLGYGKKDIDGDGDLDIANSRKALDDFEKLMDKEDFWLVII